MFNDVITVEYEVYSTRYTIEQKLKVLNNIPIMSLDFETQSIYSQDEIKEAKDLLKDHETELSSKDLKLCKLVRNSSGLSHPKITKVTHMIFGISESKSIIFIIYDSKTEQIVMDWIVNYNGKLITHNSLFDVKIIHYRTGKFPKDFEDTQLLAKCKINDTQDWQSKTGLKHIMGEYYNNKWTMIETYNITNYKDPDFLRYASIDGAATFKLWEILNETT